MLKTIYEHCNQAFAVYDNVECSDTGERKNALFQQKQWQHSGITLVKLADCLAVYIPEGQELQHSTVFNHVKGF